MPQREARAEAIRRAKEELCRELERGDEGLAARCARLGLPEPREGICSLSFFGRDARFDFSTLGLEYTEGGEASQAELILFLRCLGFPGVIRPGGELVSFRDFAGGGFYWGPFRSRTSAPLLARYGTDPASLRLALGRFSWSELGLGDFSARVLGFGSLYLTLVYNGPSEAAPGDPEAGLGAEINVLFDPVALRVFGAEEAVVFASRICQGLL